jgi:hypothetical protein
VRRARPPGTARPREPLVPLALTRFFGFVDFDLIPRVQPTHPQSPEWCVHPAGPDIDALTALRLSMILSTVHESIVAVDLERRVQALEKGESRRVSEASFSFELAERLSERLLGMPLRHYRKRLEALETALCAGVQGQPR